MLNELILRLLELEHEPEEKEKVYKAIEKKGVDRKTADLMAREYYKAWEAKTEQEQEEADEAALKLEIRRRALEKARDLGWLTHEDEQGGVEFEQGSPAGEDFLFYVHGDEDLVKGVVEYARDWDPDEHVEMWVQAKANSDNPNRSSIPSIRTLVNDADEIDEMLSALADALIDVKAEVEEQWYD